MLINFLIEIVIALKVPYLTSRCLRLRQFGWDLEHTRLLLIWNFAGHPKPVKVRCKPIHLASALFGIGPLYFAEGTLPHLIVALLKILLVFNDFLCPLQPLTLKDIFLLLSHFPL
jgi:hypothetical protein